MTGNRLNGQESVTLVKELIDGVENLSKFVRKQSFVSSLELDNIQRQSNSNCKLYLEIKHSTFHRVYLLSVWANSRCC